MRKQATIAIVGAGNLGSALALSLHGSGCRITEIVSRDRTASRGRARKLAFRVGARPTIIGDPRLRAEIVWFCVPDRAIAPQSRAITRNWKDWKGKVVLHSSGALDSSELEALRRLGATTASAHPFMTFVPGTTPSLKGVSFAVEGHPVAVRRVRSIIRLLNGIAFSIEPRHKAAYHAWGTFASPLLIALIALAERVAQSASVPAGQARRRMLPILRQTLENYAKRGAARSFSGPIIRGDVETVRKHFRVLKSVRGGDSVYRALVQSALQTLPSKNRIRLRKIIQK